MTENQWPQATPSTFDQLDPYGNPAPGTLSGPQGGRDSKTGAAKSEASDVAGQAAGAARDVAGTAKAEAATVAAEVKTNARDLLHQAKSDLTSQAGTQQQKVAEGIRSISTELRTMADTSEQPGVAADLIRQAADRSQSVASWLDGRDPGSLLDEVQTFARRRPGAFLLLAAGAGVLAGRLTRGLTAGAPEVQRSASGQAYPPAPRTAPAQHGVIGQETVFAAGDDRGLFEEPVVAGASPVSTDNLPAGGPADTTLRDDDDPFRNVPGRRTEGRPL